MANRIDSVPWHQSLQTRVFVSGVAVCAITVITLLIGASQLVSEYEKRQASQRLSAAQEAFDRVLNNRAEFVHTQLRLIAELPVFRALLTDKDASSDRPTMNQLAEHYRTQLGADECAIFDSDNKELGFAAKADPGHSVLMTYGMGRETRHFVVEWKGTLYVVVSEPAMFLTETLGVLRAAYVLDDKVAAELANLTQTEVTFLAKNAIAASSLNPADRSKIVASLTNPDARHGDEDTYFLAGRYIAGHYPLLKGTDLHAGSLLLMLDRQPTQRLLASIQGRLLWLAAIIFGIGIALLVFSSRTVSKHMRTIAIAAKDIADGDWRQRVPARGSAEAVQLAKAFNEMTEALVHWHEEAAERTRSLESAHQHLREARDAAEAANRAKSGFLASMSHELRTPLNAIIGYTEMLKEEAEDQNLTQLVPDLQRVMTASRHLLALINDILDLSKIEAGRMGLHLETFDIQPVIDEVVATLRPTAEKNSNQIRVRLGKDVGSIYADLTKVRQILFNLVSNACKFTDHGTITLDVEQAFGDKKWIELRVTDTGIGITPEQQQNLFQEFAQADASIVRKYGGTGLGLAISSRFAQMMQGRIAVVSKAGEGSTFTVELPSAVTRTTADMPPAPLRPARVPKQPEHAPEIPETVSTADTILVIDDDAAVRDLMTRFLDKLGFNVVAAENGEQGLRLAREIRPRIITLDVVMPGLNGWDVLSELKEDPNLAPIPVIMVTIVDNKTLGFDRGASNYLVKPLDRDRLALALEKYRTHPVEMGTSLN